MSNLISTLQCIKLKIAIVNLVIVQRTKAVQKSDYQ